MKGYRVFLKKHRVLIVTQNSKNVETLTEDQNCQVQRELTSGMITVEEMSERDDTSLDLAEIPVDDMAHEKTKKTRHATCSPSRSTEPSGKHKATSHTLMNHIVERDP